MQFDLVERGDYTGFIDDAPQVFGAKIRYADRLRLACIAQFDKRFPGVDELVLLRAGPVDEQHVDMIAAKPFEAFVRRLERPVVALAVVPDLGLQENVRPGADAFADAFLIAIDRCGIDQPIADIERGLDRLGGVGIVDLVSAEAKLRDLAAIVERERGVIGHDVSFGSPMVDTAHVSAA